MKECDLGERMSIKKKKKLVAKVKQKVQSIYLLSSNNNSESK